MTRSYYTGAQGAVIMYNITERESLRNVSKWLDAFKSVCPNAEIILIGNKNDLVSQRKVELTEGMQLAQEERISFLETSAKSGKNCLRAMQILLEEIHKKATREELEAAANQQQLNDSTSSTIRLDQEQEVAVPENACCGGWVPSNALNLATEMMNDPRIRGTV
jgi:GTPase SAR1 family protein